MPTTYTWQSVTSGDWSVASAWSGGTVPNDVTNAVAVLDAAGGYTVTVSAGENFAVSGLLIETGTLALLASGNLQVGGAASIAPGGVLSGGGVLFGAGSLTNQGRIEGNDPSAFLFLNTARFSNSGTVLANGGIVYIDSAGFANLSANTLTGGVYEVDAPASGNLAQILVAGASGAGNEVVTDDATITLNGEAAYFSATAGTQEINLEATLSQIAAAGVLNVIGGRDYLGSQSITNAGTITLGGGDFSTTGLASSGTIEGFGTIAAIVANTGLIAAVGGILTLSGGVTGAGQLGVAANAVLALSGSVTGAIIDNGVLQAEGGLLKLTGTVSGTGGFVIDSPTPSVAGTLELATSVSAEVAFNGPRGVLKLDSPGSFTGTVTGFGQGDPSGRAPDTIDIAGIVGNGATLSGNTLLVQENGTTVYGLTLNGGYTANGIAFGAVSDGAGGTDITVSGIEARDYARLGPYWHSKTVTWSFATSNLAGEQGPAFSDFLASGTLPGDTRDQSQYQAVVRQALAEWSGLAGIGFVQVTDGATADLRIGWGNFVGAGGEIGQASSTSQSDTILPDVIIRAQDPAQLPLVADPSVLGGLDYSGTSTTLYQVFLHEIGHGLGLAHSTDPDAVMYPVAEGAQNQTPDASDIAGIRAIYGSVACFAAGTRIATLRGPVGVEALRVGEVVDGLVSGARRAVRWIGQRLVDPARHPRPHEVLPVRVQADAFAPGVPERDVWLSPDHAVLIDGVLIPVRYLINGATIRQETVKRVRYFHVELADEDGGAVHDALLADGLPVESFLDTGNRGAFANGGAAVHLHPDFARRIWAARGCAPLLTGGAPVVAVRRGLLARAAVLGHELTDNAALRVIAAHGPLPCCMDGRRWDVSLPAGTARVRLVSRAWQPLHTRADETDARRLGVAVAGLWIDGRRASLDSPALGGGWHASEGGWRWTDGDATIATAGARAIGFELGLSGSYWERQPDPRPARAPAARRRSRTRPTDGRAA